MHIFHAIIFLDISEVECPDQLTRTCANLTVTIEKFDGRTGQLTCSTGHSLEENDTVTCMEDGVWSPIKAICKNLCFI